ncbi:hypothetical protein [Pseudomonas sp. NPDC007930]|uniref:hypothetical protein n=1 Tax=Pseudomonas sp. NPDC007930 TaxID=3364417 RepID=UPI0036E0E879
MENLHGFHEEKALPVLAALADEKIDVLQDKRHMIKFMMFFGHQISRTKNFRDGVIQVQSWSNNLGIEVADATAHAWWLLSYMFGMSHGLSLYVSRHEDRHVLLVNDTRVPFNTPDHPVVNVHSCVSETEFAAPEYIDFYYPISPRVAYIICNSERFVTGRNEVNEIAALELNSKVATQSMTHIIGDKENAILPFMQYIGRRNKRTPDGHVIV